MTYNSNDGPYRGTMTFNVVSGPLEMDQFTLNFEAFPNTTAAPVRSFSAIDSDSGPLFFGYSGYYQKQN